MMQTNEWTLRREAVLIPVQLPEITQEQSVELDYMLPDYYPDFFRLLHCTADAAVTARERTENAVHYTLRVQLHVLYCGEQTEAVQAITQQLEYQGQIPLSQEHAAVESLQIRLSAEPSYMNCRAVSQRRIDMRGAVRIRAQFSGEQCRELLSGAEGLHVQTRAESVTYVSQLLRTEKRFVLTEDIRLTAAQPPLLSVLRTQTALSVTETRVVAGKLVVKGEAAVTLLYAAENGIENLTSVLPFSQIVEQEGLSDDIPCMVTPTLSEQLITTESENDGDIRLLHCDLQILLHCEAVRTASAALLTDLYSTVHPAIPERESVSLMTLPMPIAERMQQKITLTQQDTVLTRVYAAWAEPENMQTAPNPDGSGAALSGTLHCCVLAADAENHPLMLEGREPFTWILPQIAASQILPPIRVQSCSYTLSGSDSVTLQPELLLSGEVMQQQTHTLLTGVQIDPEERLPVADSFALRLYFGQPEESLWEIAKRYHTSEAAIREENDIPADRLTEAQMLLIPIVI